jgi:hypothetical protein
MSTLSADTDPKIEKIQIELLRKASPARKFDTKFTFQTLSETFWLRLEAAL